ncbi:MAG: FAD-dependent oxidoreductase [Deltaproteobacteria bacterium]|nr:FAD-dependent oxidoreductase [Deltaproteobacteria bacterium]
MPPVISREHYEAILFKDEFPWYQTRTSPCEANCPAGNNIQRTVSLIRDNRFEEALVNLKATNPLPGITGRVCFYPCETACNRGQYDDRISIRFLERAVSDHADRNKVKKAKRLPDTNRSVAIIGSGPAGLSCAYYSSLLGHSVTIFEASKEIGGVLNIIPMNRLPMDVVKKEVGEIVELGLKVRTGTEVGKDIQLEDILNDYDACLIATGAWESKSLNIPGNENAISALTYLSDVSQGKVYDLGDRVVVIGSGGTAFDCATTALRTGAQEVHLAALETMDDMLATPEEIERGLSEGIILHNSKTFTGIVSNNGKVKGIECLDIKSFEFDENGALRLETVEGSEQLIEADSVIFAIGQGPVTGFAEGVDGICVSGRRTLASEKEGVFVAGDVATGPKSIVEAIGGGRMAAMSIHNYLTGDDKNKKIDGISIDAEGKIRIETYNYKGEGSVPQRVVDFRHLANVEYYDNRPRVEVNSLSVSLSLSDFDEINKGYSKAKAIEESDRCFHCGHCFECGTCVDVCPEDIYEITEEGIKVKYPDECFICGACVMDCPCSAITMRIPAPMRLAAVRAKR